MKKYSLSAWMISELLSKFPVGRMEVNGNVNSLKDFLDWELFTVLKVYNYFLEDYEDSYEILDSRIIIYDYSGMDVVRVEFSLGLKITAEIQIRNNGVIKVKKGDKMIIHFEISPNNELSIILSSIGKFLEDSNILKEKNPEPINIIDSKYLFANLFEDYRDRLDDYISDIFDIIDCDIVDEKDFSGALENNVREIIKLPTFTFQLSK